MLDASQTKHGRYTEIKINNSLLDIAKRIIINVQKYKCKGKIVCYDVDQNLLAGTITKNELIEMFNSKSRFNISYIDQDPECTINTIVKMGKCKLDKYTLICSGDDIRMIIFEFNFNNRNLAYEVESMPVEGKEIEKYSFMHKLAKDLAKEIPASSHNIVICESYNKNGWLKRNFYVDGELIPNKNVATIKEGEATITLADETVDSDKIK